MLGPELCDALEKRGFEGLTAVQEAVLSPELAGCDLRISSQTGSGKTVAIGLTIREDIAGLLDEQGEPSTAETSVKGRAQPRAIVVTPTRELAKQVEEELSWLYAPLGARVTCVTGGGGYRDELRAFRANPAIIVGTPGRLLDHLDRGAIDASKAGTVVLDEADRMLDLGFREDLLKILEFFPEQHNTHLVSATFPREVRALADRVQREPVNVEGTPLGTANLDIEHHVHLVLGNERLAAIMNLLLENPGAQSLIFARTRADVASIADSLSHAGFSIAMLSGEMEQAERNRALAAFKRGNVDALVATDVAARGIDVQGVARVIHAEPPSDPDAYTHRSGRTGRAGRKGVSSMLVTERELGKVSSLLSRARVTWSFAPVPSAESLRGSQDRSLLDELTRVDETGESQEIDARSLKLAEALLASEDPARSVAKLVQLAVGRSRVEPQRITKITPPSPSGRRASASGERRDRRGAPSGPHEGGGDFVAFRVSWGEAHGAEARRLVAMMCRRGNIEGRDIGAIRIGRTSSVIEVSGRVAAQFEKLTQKPDPRDPRVHVRRWSEEPVRRKEHTHEDSARPPRAPKEHAPKEHAPKEHAPKEHAPKEHAPKEHAPKEHAPKYRDARGDAQHEAPRPRPKGPPKPYAKPKFKPKKHGGATSGPPKGGGLKRKPK